MQMNQEGTKFEKKFQFEHKYPATKIMWNPEPSPSLDLLVTSGETLQVWEVENNERAVRKANLVGVSAGLTKTKKELTGPLTSFDWSSKDPHIVITCSIDTTCSIWDIQKEQVNRTVIAHDREVYDVSFSPDRQIFATVGADGSARQFDIRDLSKSDILFETPNSPILRVAWNKNDAHHVALICMDDHSVTLLDTRKQSSPCARLEFHRAPVNHLAWAPHSAYHICSVSDDRQALIWDIKKMQPEIKAPLLEYSAEGEISNLSWGIQESDWIALCFGKRLQVLRVY